MKSLAVSELGKLIKGFHELIAEAGVIPSTAQEADAWKEILEKLDVIAAGLEQLINRVSSAEGVA